MIQFFRPRVIIVLPKEEWREDDESYYINFLASSEWKSIRKKFTNRISALKEEMLTEMTDAERNETIAKINELSDFLLGFDNDAHTG